MGISMNTNRLIAAAVASVLSVSAPAGFTADALEEVVVTGRVGTRELTKPELSFAATTIDADRLRFIAPLSTAEVRLGLRSLVFRAVQGLEPLPLLRATRRV